MLEVYKVERSFTVNFSVLYNRKAMLVVGIICLYSTFRAILFHLYSTFNAIWHSYTLGYLFAINGFIVLFSCHQNNSAGLLCNQCESGFFYLTSSNPEGCTNCVCMGISANCSSSQKYRKEASNDFYLVANS